MYHLCWVLMGVSNAFVMGSRADWLQVLSWLVVAGYGGLNWIEWRYR